MGCPALKPVAYKSNPTPCMSDFQAEFFIIARPVNDHPALEQLGSQLIPATSEAKGRKLNAFFRYQGYQYCLSPWIKHQKSEIWDSSPHK